MLIYRYLFSLILFPGLLSLQAQEVEDPYSVPMDTTIKHQGQIIPTGLRVGFDVLGLALGANSSKRDYYEGEVDIDFNNFNLTVEAGKQTFQENLVANYSSTGTYYRIGPDANFLTASKELNQFFFGIRYSFASYEEAVQGSIDGKNYGNIPVDVVLKNSTTRWLELTSGVKVRMFNQLFMGYTARFRFGRTSDDPQRKLQPYYIPGYGLADQANTWFFNYYIFYRFQWKKKIIKYNK